MSGARLRLDRHRLGLRRQRQRAPPRREGLQGRRPRGGPPLPRRGLREDDLERAPLLLAAAPRPPRHLPHDALQGRLRRLRLRRRRRQPRLRQHALPAHRGLGVLPRPAVGRARGLGDDARAPLRDRGEDARRHPVRGRGAGRHAAARARRGVGRAGDLLDDPRRRLLRRARQDRARPLLRRRGPAARRLHPLRRVHGRLPPQRQEHAAEELPLLRRARRRGDPARAHRRRGPPARRGRRLAAATASPASAPARGSTSSARR